MKKLIYKLLLFSPILLFVSIINIIIDPANIFHAGYEETAAQLILSKVNIVGLSNYDERLFQQYAILESTEVPDVVFIGSSRVMEMSSEILSGHKTCWNAGLSGAGINDYLGIIGLYISKGIIPRQIILGLDPWILNENNGDERYKSLSFYIDITQSQLNDSNETWRKIHLYYNLWTNSLLKYSQAISPSYFQASIEAIKSNSASTSIVRQYDFSTTTNQVSDEAIRYYDGSIDYDIERRSRTIDEVDSIVNSFINGDIIYQMEDYYELNMHYKKTLSSLLEYLKRNNTEIILYLAPFHPDAYDYLVSQQDYRMLQESEDYFRSLARELELPIYGSYNPHIIHCSENYFMDAMHLKRAYIEHAYVKTDQLNQ